MPVLVTPVATDLARRLVQRLLDEGGQVRAVARDHVGRLRAAGAMVAVAEPDDPGRLEAAMAQVHTVIHVPELFLRNDVDTLKAEAQAVAEAAAGAGVARLIVRSLVGASPDATDPLRAALGEVERYLVDLPLPTVVVRTGLVAEAELRAVLAGTPLPPSIRATAVGVVDVDAIVEVLARLDAVRSNATAGHVTFDASTAAATTLGDEVQRWQDGAQPAVYVAAASVPLLQAALAGPWQRDGDALDGWTFTGVAPAGTAAW